MIKRFILLFIFVFFVFFSSFFIIEEGQKGIILRFGKVLKDYNDKSVVYNPGLNFKFPFIDSVKVLSSRINTMENQADRFVTKEKKDLIVDSYVKWKISDFNRYYLATGGGDTDKAEILLKRKFSDRLRSEMGKLNVKEIVTDSRGRLTVDVKDSLNDGSINFEIDNNINLHDETNYIYRDKKYVSINQNSMNALGIEVVDVRIKQINLPIEVSDAIYNRMRAEREAVARSQRSKGQEEAEKLRAIADYKVTKTLAEANSKSLIIRGIADAEVYRLFSDSFKKDVDFYIFIRSLKAYENSFINGQDFMLLSPENSFLRYMKNLNGN
ncbi:protease modulator HflC [Buchnera aphidicola (Neophyllaphis podocarpi)]|uniref:protease modulator HflC n=1 Tax=Buchnera aphidicola TaxID=9 RepID=UPI0031B85AD6